jgi:hypothetical protein
VAGCCECGDEPLGYGTMELVSQILNHFGKVLLYS